ncbi:MAG: hypothetical protein KTR28_00345 [Micavibrio sp.]|nr:hypothetical protein [Micavibrio sp.]
MGWFDNLGYNYKFLDEMKYIDDKPVVKISYEGGEGYWENIDGLRKTLTMPRLSKNSKRELNRAIGAIGDEFRAGYFIFKGELDDENSNNPKALFQGPYSVERFDKSEIQRKLNNRDFSARSIPEFVSALKSIDAVANISLSTFNDSVTNYKRTTHDFPPLWNDKGWRMKYKFNNEVGYAKDFGVSDRVYSVCAILEQERIQAWPLSKPKFDKVALGEKDLSNIFLGRSMDPPPTSCTRHVVRDAFYALQDYKRSRNMELDMGDIF